MRVVCVSGWVVVIQLWSKRPLAVGHEYQRSKISLKRVPDNDTWFQTTVRCVDKREEPLTLNHDLLSCSSSGQYLSKVVTNSRNFKI